MTTATAVTGRKKRNHGRRMLERYNGSKLDWFHDIIFLVILVAIIFCVFRFCIGIAIVGGESMSPTLIDGDFVVYNRMIPQYRQGDIVSIRVASGDYYVKRVIATGGDVVDIHDGKVYVNGEELINDWGYGATKEEARAIVYPYTVREGNVFVMGDNRAASMDSRAFGEVNVRQIRGKIFLQAGIGSTNGLYIKTITDE